MMKLKATIAMFQFIAMLLCLAILLFTAGLAQMTWVFAGAIVREIAAVCRDDACRWMLVVCLLVYLGVFLFWEFREKKGLQVKIVPLGTGEISASLSGESRPAAAILLIALVVLSLGDYASNYPLSARSLQILTLLAGIVVGKAFSVWVNVTSFRNDTTRSRAIRRVVSVLAMIVGLLSVAALYQPDSGPAYAYHDIHRWTGPWDNPNLFGLLMGVGVVLAAGLGLGRWRIEDGRSQISKKNWQRRFWRRFFILLCLVAVILLGRGLYHSLSRGAWLGTAVGMVYLLFNYAHFPMNSTMVGRTPHPKAGGRARHSVRAAVSLFWTWRRSRRAEDCTPYQLSVSGIQCASQGWENSLPIGSSEAADAERERRSRRNHVGMRRVIQGFKARDFGEREAISNHPCVSWLNQNRLPLIAIALSVFVIGFWQLRFSKFQAAQRMASVADPNDFSWRNRLSAWQGAIRMMIDKPLTGFGWGKAESVYAKRYCTTASNESAAIQMNDYLMLGISGGVPVMLCFIGYVVLAFRRKGPRLHFSSGLAPSSQPSPPAGEKVSVGRSRGTLAWDWSFVTQVESLQAVCRAGVIVLLVGFWFDGGLFKLPTAVVFWTLLELSRLEFAVPQTALASAAVANERLRVHHDGAHGVPRPIFGNRHNRWLTRAAWCAVIVAVGVSAFYLFAPYLPVSGKAIAIARHYLILPKERDDFDFLADKPIWHGQKLKTLLDQAELAHYNRELINWKVDEKIYRNYVLSPIIEPSPTSTASSLNLNWRRSLWEAFYPRIRHENSPADAAQIVVRHLHERVSIADLPNPPRSVSVIWRSQITDEKGFQIIYVAALRSVGVPARLDANGQAEFYDGQEWQIAPPPCAIKNYEH
jgi:hypothetical protein